MNLDRVLVGCACAVVVGAPALAGFSQSGIIAPGGFVQSGSAGSSAGAGHIPGQDLQSAITSHGGNFQEQAFAGLNYASASTSFSGGNTSNSSYGQVGMGLIRMSAANNAPNSSFFAEAQANGGFKESFVINVPGQTGQSAIMTFSLSITGTLAASGFAGAASFNTTGYVNNNELMSNPFWDPGASDPIATDRQRAKWGASSAPDITRTINDSITMAAPIVIGTPFTLGIYAHASAGMRSSSGVPGNSQASMDFTSTLLWTGIQNVLIGGQPAPEFSVNSATGLNWRGVVPAPGAAGLALLAMASAARRRKA